MRYVPSEPKQRWSWFKGWTWRQRVRAAFLLLLALLLITVLSGPARHEGEFIGAFYRGTADFVLSGLGWVLAVPVLGALALVLLLTGCLWLARLTSKDDRLDRVLTAAFPWLGRAVLVLVPAALVVVVLLGALRTYVTPHIADHPFTHIASAHATTSPLLLNLGTYRLTPGETRLSGTHLATGDNVVSIAAFPPAALFERPLDPVSDVLERDGTVLVVSGRQLFQIGRAGDIGLLARLPLDAMRLGAFAEPRDASAKILLTGGTADAGYVFELTSDKEYSKIVDLDVPVVGAAGCLDDVAVAVADRVLLVSPGRYPRVLLRRPEGDGPFTSIRARWVEGMDPPCLWLIATPDRIYLHQDGLTVLIASGLGGLITDAGLDAVRDSEPALTFVLLDAPRRTIVEMTLDRRR